MFVSEYDAFGPWIYEINEEHPVPRLFAPYMQEQVPYLMLFKIPRDVERRRATPDMALYDYVVGACDDHIRILKRVGQAVESSSVSYGDIEGVRLFRHFLRGVLTLYLRDGQCDIPFNTVSLDIITRFVQLVRARYKGDADSAPAGPGGQERAQDDMDVLFVNLLGDMRKEGEEVRLCAYQPLMPLELKNGSPLQSLALRVRPRQLPAAIHLLGRGELILVQREAASQKNQKNEFRYHFTYLPLNGIRSVRLAESERYRDVTDCTVELEHHSVSFALSRENREAIGFYETLGASTGRQP